jgi:hypothetical protein
MLQRPARCRADFPIAARGASLQAMGARLGLFPGFILPFLHGEQRSETRTADEKSGANPVTEARFLWQSAAAAFHQG